MLCESNFGPRKERNKSQNSIIMTKSYKQITTEKSIEQKRILIQACLDCMSIAIKENDAQRIHELAANAADANKEMRHLQYDLSCLKSLHNSMLPTERALLKEIQYSELDGPAVGYGEWTAEGADAFTLGTVESLLQDGIIQPVETENGSTVYISTEDAPIL